MKKIYVKPAVAKRDVLKNVTALQVSGGMSYDD